MRAASSTRVHSGRQHRIDGGYLEPILCPCPCGTSTSSRHHPSAPTPTPGSDRGDTRQKPYLGLQGWLCWSVDGVNTGTEGLWQGGERGICSNTNSFIRSFTYLFIQQVVEAFLLQGGHCAQLQRAHLFPGHRTEEPSFAHDFNLPSP